MSIIKKYIDSYSNDFIGFIGSGVIGAGIGLAICKFL